MGNPTVPPSGGVAENPSPTTKKDEMVGTPPAPEALARWLLSTEAAGDPSPDARAAAAERVHLRLREGLIVFLGPTGFDSLWARALHLARPTPVVVWCEKSIYMM